MTMPELLDSSDYTLAQNRNLEFFLDLAGDVIRGYCQWHIAPVIEATFTLPVTYDGLIVLPTKRLVSVRTLVVGGETIDTSKYVSHDCGYIELTSPFVGRRWRQTIEAEVTFTHGYDETPYSVRDVGNRVAQRAMTMGLGRAADIAAGPFTASYDSSLQLDESDMAELVPYVCLKYDM